MNSIVVYTAITGNYDTLKQPKVINKNIDYICFTDNQHLNGGAWRIRPIPIDVRYLSNVKKQRILKICPHRYLKDYDISIWVDGSFEIQDDLLAFINQYDLEKCPLYVRIHPTRKCIYIEAEECIRQKKDDPQTINNQIEQYKKDGYPKNIGMVETGILLRKHNNKTCQLIDNAWATEILKHSHRDQLSFNYICWKMHFIPGYLTNEFKTTNRFFKINAHG